MGNARNRIVHAFLPVSIRSAAVLGIAAAGVTMLLLFLLLQVSPDPPGADGYYYLKQIETLSAGNGYYYKDQSLAFLLPAAATLLTGQALTAFRLCISITITLLLIAGGMLTFLLSSGFDMTRRARVAVSLAALFSLACSLTIYEFTFEYYKNAFAPMLLLFSFVVLGSGPADAKRRSLIAALLVLAAFFSHKSAMIFVMAFTLLWFLKCATQKNFPVISGIGIASLAAFVVFFAQGRHYLMALPSFLTGPASWFEWLSYIARKEKALFITVCADFAAVILYSMHRDRVSARLVTLFDTLCFIMTAAFIPFFTAGPSSPAYRVLLFSPLFSIPVLLACTVKPRWQIVTLAAGLVLVLFLSQVFIDRSRLIGHFASWSGLDRDIMLVPKHVTKSDHLIAHHGLEFYVDYRTGIRARQFLSSNDRKTSFRIAYVPDGRPAGEARNAIDSLKLEKIGENYALFREKDWRELSDRYQIKLHWKNPSTVRPDYIPNYD